MHISRPQRARTKLTTMASRNAEEALARHMANATSQKRLLRLARRLIWKSHHSASRSMTIHTFKDGTPLAG